MVLHTLWPRLNEQKFGLDTQIEMIDDKSHHPERHPPV
jgi:hypothetical protein